MAGRRAARLLEIAEEECECAEADGITGFPLLWERDKATILADLAGVLAADDARRARYGVVPWRTELPFGTGGTEPVRLGLGDGRVLLLRGMADRVDRAPSGGRIVVIDYKTGSIRPYRHLGATDPTHRGRRLQLPVYALAARAAVGDHDGSGARGVLVPEPPEQLRRHRLRGQRRHPGRDPPRAARHRGRHLGRAVPGPSGQGRGGLFL